MAGKMPKETEVKIFVGYYKPNTIFKSDVYQPILTCDTDWNPEGFIKDNTGINIASQNPYYGELTGHYWVWKNFVPNTKAKYIGFCHYRRFLDFNITPQESLPYEPILEKDFKKKFKQYSEKKIMEIIDGYDLILPEPAFFRSILYTQYMKWHPNNEMNLALNIIRDFYPQYVEITKKVMAVHAMHTCLNFIMKKELFNEYMEWAFGILNKLDEKVDWTKYTDYSEIRTPAFIMERFFNIWLAYNILAKNLKALTTSSFMIVGEEYGNENPELYIQEYKKLAERYKEEMIK
jgi:hypothetical protein